MEGEEFSASWHGEFKPSYTKIGGLLVADESPGHAFERAVLFSGVS